MASDIFAQNWQQARSAAEQKGWEIIELGWEQHVIIDLTGGYVYRYPRNGAAAAKLADEVEVLRQIHNRQWPIKLPVLLEHNDIFTKYEYIAGEVMDEFEVNGLKLTDFEQIGLGLGIFLAQFHQLEPAVIAQKKTKHTTSLLEYYARRIDQGKKLDFYPRAAAALERLLSSAGRLPHVVMHGDLHGPNIVIDPATKLLQGVIDLSEMETGDPHQEFRKLFMTHPKLLEPSLAAYRHFGGPELDTELVKTWAYVNEWANLCYFADSPDNITYRRAVGHLKFWQLI